MVYLTPTHHNPTGAVMPETARYETARLATEFGIPVIEDCTLADMELDGRAPKPIAAFAANGGVVSIGSLSKLFWSGLRIGWIRASVPAIAQLARVKTADDLGSPLMTQTIASQLLTVVREARAIRREQIRVRRDLLMELLQKHFPEWTFSSPTGGICLWVDLAGRDSRRFSQVAARRGVAITPGSMFACDDSFSDFLRIPFLLEEDRLRAGIIRLREAWDEYCSATPVETARSMTIV